MRVVHTRVATSPVEASVGGNPQSEVYVFVCVVLTFNKQLVGEVDGEFGVFFFPVSRGRRGTGFLFSAPIVCVALDGFFFLFACFMCNVLMYYKSIGNLSSIYRGFLPYATFGT